MVDPRTPASTQVRAADSIFNHAAKAIEIEDIEARVSEPLPRGGNAESYFFRSCGTVQAYAKINASGEWIERTENVNLSELFTRMSPGHCECDTPAGKKSRPDADGAI
jgi:hypothetical protein